MRIYYIDKHKPNRADACLELKELAKNEIYFVVPALNEVLPNIKNRIREMLTCDQVVTSTDFYEDDEAVRDLEVARHMGMNVQSIIRFKNDIKGNNRKG